MRDIKNRQDPRYLNNRRKINRVFLEYRNRGQNNIGVVLLCDKIGVVPSTFYDHYPNMDAVLQGAEQDLYQEFFRYIDNLNLKESSQDNFQAFFRKLLLFISKHPVYFQQALNHSETEWFLQVFQKLRPFLTGKWCPREPKILQFWFDILCFELIGAIYAWGNDHFDPKTMHRYYYQLTKIACTAEMRLRQFSNTKIY